MNDLARAALERVAARSARGEAPPDGRIPISKESFPKVLCLDQNKWIDLARSHYGLDGGAPFAEALEKIRGAIARGRLVVPILPSNAAEIAEPKDEERRQRTATFMVELAGNRFFAYPDPVADAEISRAVRQQYLAEDVGPYPRAELVRWGLPVGDVSRIWPAEYAHLADVVREPEWSIATLVHAQSREDVASMRAMDERAASASRLARANGVRAQRYDEELRNLFREGGSFSTRMYREVQALGITPKTFELWLDDNRRQFAEAIPSLDVEIRLMLARDRNEQHRTHKNDLKDLVFLQTAIPHGNIVVTENSWAHLARTERMDRRYGTEILADLRQLPEVLRSTGCLS